MKNSEQDLFFKLFNCHTEGEIENVINNDTKIFQQYNWHPLGGNENNYGVIENQQASPIAALIEKITNSIDATLMKKCYEAGIDPKSDNAPKTMDNARALFFPEHKNWDLNSHRKNQAKNIQILADGPKLNPSLTIYDNGEGQHPVDFEKSFLSLLSGNKNEIHFVQGKYNMGGSGAIIFCGKNGYQLIASRKYDKKGEFGFTLVRQHPLSVEEQVKKKNTWYEFLKIDGKIPSFKIDKIDLKLHDTLFETGTIIKLYSYDLPSGSRSVISRDLNQSINEFLFEPALPILTVDRKDRYPDDRNLERDLFGLKRRLEGEENKYLEDYFSEEYAEDEIGKFKVTCYVFNSRIDDKNIKETKESIQREFFKNNMSVLFSMNGQVHGNFSSEFITRSLKFNLLKYHLLIHVDCTAMNYNFRKDLFMASRDRLKEGDHTSKLRKFLTSKLGTSKGRLAEIERRRKDSISVDSKDTQEMLKSFSKNLPMDSSLMKLLNQTFKLEQKDNKLNKKDNEKKQVKKEQEPFKPQRFPSFLHVKSQLKDGKSCINLPRGQEKTIHFNTDVENHYFDRVEEPGIFSIGLVSYQPKQNDAEGGTSVGKSETVEEVFNITTSSPHDGTIRLNLKTKHETRVGDEIEMKATLTGAGEDFEELFWVKITEPEEKKEAIKKEEKEDIDNLGLPPFVLVYKEPKEGFLTWDQISEGIDAEMDYDTVMAPQVSGDNLEKIIINMDSHVLKNFKSKYKDQSQLEISERKYISSVYFHTLFLYTITKNRKYTIYQGLDSKEEEVDLQVYLRDLFSSYYSEFILNFGTNDLLQMISE
ncbi:hypothetical protein [Pedobacter sp. UBA5917]|jgi:hypothetical protein|uniref:hypothetical protein n=1 Tax=Pedobacter sp. UBA5917 TaxID=1947061 RepID=UPI0025E3ADA2|nr:hypothetical protein [Pedobacter sp. UBA5917]